MSILGSRVLRTEDPRLLTAGGTYVDDLREPLLEGALHATFVRSAMAHATFTIDTSDALGAPGVVAIYTAADIDIAPLPPNPPVFPPVMARPWLATGTVRFVGEPVAVVLTEERYQGADAAELVVVDYEPLPVVIDLHAAKDGSDLLFPDMGTNICASFSDAVPDDLFEGCEVVVEQALVNQRVAAAPLEVRGTAAAVAPDGRLHVWCSTQGAQAVRDSIVGALGAEPGSVRVVAPDVGGGFGGKIGAHHEDLLVPWLAKKAGRPVRWTETRTENMQAMGHGRGQAQVVRIGGTREGKVLAYHLDVIQDAGAYPGLGAFLPFLTKMMTAAVYDIPKVVCTTTSVVTNTMTTIAYRGAGRPEATAAAERAMDLFAAEIGKDPAEVRRINLIPADKFPFTTPMGTTYDNGEYVKALDLALEASGYAGLREEQAARRAAGDPLALGIGVSTYVEVTAGPTAGSENAKVEITPSGGATVYTGTSPHGQGHATSWAMLASERLGIPMDQIEVIHGDTDLVPVGVGTFGSRSLQLGGAAVNEASGMVLEKAKELAADLFEAAVDDIEVVDGRFQVKGTPAQAKGWDELAAAANGKGDPLAADAVFQAESPTFPFGAHVAVVEVDTETGKVVVKRIVAVDDAGRILNPVVVEGQRHGGIAQGVAQALCEAVLYDEDGNLVSSNFADYTFISACEVPSFELVPMETPTHINPLGAKGIGESGAIGSTPAVQSAVTDALSHLGVRHVDIPTTPERVWQAINDAKGAGS